MQTIRTVASTAHPILGALVVTLLVSCVPAEVTATEWQRLSPDDRLLYVSSLLGEEKAKEAKGGGGKRYDLPAAEYVKKIDEAYARGDQRRPQEIFAEMGR